MKPKTRYQLPPTADDSMLGYLLVAVVVAIFVATVFAVAMYVRVANDCDRAENEANRAHAERVIAESWRA